MKSFAKLSAVWGATVLVHFLLIFEAQLNPQTAPFNDVNLYGYWVDQLQPGAGIFGVDTAWVYPFVALLPMLAAQAIGGAGGILGGWLTLIGFLNLLALSVLVNWGRAGKSAFRAAAYFLSFIALLGPVAIGRIDAVATVFAVLGIILVYRNRLHFAMVFFTFGAWIKVWPVAGAIALFSSAKTRLRFFDIALAASGVLVAVAVFFGANEKLFSFVFTQGNRGLQVESVAATFWLWAAKFGAPGAGIYFDNALVTNQVSGVFTAEISSLLSLAMIIALGITLFLGLRAHRAKADSRELFIAVFLTATLDLIVFNKVGSPQFELWLVVPIMAGLLLKSPQWKTPLICGVAIAWLTNLVYPILYMDLMILGWPALLTLSLRNALLVLLLVWANVRLTRLGDQSARS